MRKIFLFLSLIAFTLVAGAQDTLHFTQTIFSVHSLDTLTGPIPGFTLTDSIYVSGVNELIDSVAFGVTINSVPVYNQRCSVSGLSTIDSFPVNQRKRIDITVHNDTAPPFIIGPNTIVIWPVYSPTGYGGPKTGYTGPRDSIRITANFFPLAISESPLAKMYIFQTGGQLNIAFGDAEPFVQQVRICDIPGQDLYLGPPEQSKHISTAGWRPGVYLCQIITVSGERKTFKFRAE